MRKKLNCPNCGAPISGVKCNYCGTQFFDLADMELDKAGYLSIKINGTVHHFKAVPYIIECENFFNDSYIPYGADEIVSTIRPFDKMTVKVEFRVVAEADGTMMRQYIEAEKE